MKEKKQYPIHKIYDELCSIDPEWGDAKMQSKFKILYDGWRQQGLRHRKRSSFFYTRAWRRGWLSLLDWMSLREYVMQ